MVLLLSNQVVLRTRWTLTALALICSYNGGLLLVGARVGDMSRAMQDIALIGPNQGGASSTVDGNGDRVRQITVAAAKCAVNAGCAGPKRVRGSALVAGLAESRPARG